jgi:hypothetical protein
MLENEAPVPDRTQEILRMVRRTEIAPTRHRPLICTTSPPA